MIRIIFLSFAALSLIGCASTYVAGSDGGNSNYYSKAVNHFPTHRAATGKKTFVFSPRYKVWAAYDENGNRVKVGPATGGSDRCPDQNRSCRTVTGKYSVLRKGEADCTSGKYPLGEGGAPMAYCMHFYKGFSIHGAPGFPDYHHSHGCIRVTNQDARWLNEDFLNVGSSVVVQPY